MFFAAVLQPVNFQFTTAKGKDIIIPENVNLEPCTFHSNPKFLDVFWLIELADRLQGPFTMLYTLAAVSTRSDSLFVLALGHIAGGAGTSLLFSAPEAWFVTEHQREGGSKESLSATFGYAYTGDALCAVLAGLLASKAVAITGPTGPFVLSVGFLVAAAVATMLM